MKLAPKTKFIFVGLVLLISTCKKDDPHKITGVDFKREMRHFVIGISNYAKGINPNFVIIPQNGQEIITQTGNSDGSLSTEYLDTIDGVGREDLFYGYNNDNMATPDADKSYMITFCDICKQNDVQVLVTDYCSTQSKMDDSYSKNYIKGYISFAAPQRDLNVIPTYPVQPFNVNSNNIDLLSDVKNFLYIINPETFDTKQTFITAIAQTNYDLIIIDCFFNDEILTTSDVALLKTKNNGGTRLVVCYMSIGEAEDYRYYWQTSWSSKKPAWLAKENPDWAGNYKVRYWYKEWQDIIFGNNNSYLKKILDSGFDGVYLDIIDAFEYFE